MPKKKKAKPNVKEQQAHYRKAFLRKTIAMAEQIGVEDFRVLMSAEMLESLYAMRIRINMADLDHVPASIRKELRQRHDELLSTYEVTLCENGPSASLRDFLTYGQTLYFFITSDYSINLKKGKVAEGCRPEVLRERLAHFVEWLEERVEPYQRLVLSLWHATLPYNDLTRQLYWIDYRFTVENVRINHTFEVRTMRPERRVVCLDGKNRSVFRVGWVMPKNEPEWISLDRRLFGDTVPGEGELPVFVQAHALHRMTERLQGTDNPTRQFYLFLSLSKPEVVQNQQGQWLIAYYYQGYKLGYFVADFVDNILVIRTFLFVTMDRTPEGNALQESIGLEAVDKKYLAIDRFSTFLISDIAEHPDIKAHFINAGCEDLFQFEAQNLDPADRTEVADFMRTYLDVPKAEKVLPMSAPANVAERLQLEEV